MNCTNCGTVMPENARFCAFCGNDNDAPGTSAITAAPSSANPPQQSEHYQHNARQTPAYPYNPGQPSEWIKPSNKGKPNVWIPIAAAAAVLLVIAAAVGGYLLGLHALPSIPEGADSTETVSDDSAADMLTQSPDFSGNIGSAQLDDLFHAIQDYINTNGLGDIIAIENEGDQLLMTFPSDMAFSAGNPIVSEEIRFIVGELAQIIAAGNNEETPFEVTVTGHTDSRPPPNTFRSNWQLSVIRAVNFLEVLLEESELNPDYFFAKGIGEYHPIDTNDTQEGRQANRRIEVMISFSSVFPTLATATTENPYEPYEPMSVDVHSVTVMHGRNPLPGSPNTPEFSLRMSDGSISLNIAVEPLGVEDVPVWTSGDTSIFEVIPTNPDAYEATVRPIGIGTATLTVTVGGVAQTVTVRILSN